jgi:polyhydroxyalkanoate synthesis regulator protein
LLVEDEIERDSTIENDLILLLSELEQLIVRLEEKKGKQPILSVQCLSDMVNRLAEFSGRVMNIDPREGFMVKVLRKVSDRHSQMQLLHSQGNRLSVQTAVNLYYGWAGDLRERHQVFHQICVGVVEVMESFFSFFVSSFRSAEMRDQWKDACTTFTGDLKKMIDKIQF